MERFLDIIRAQYPNIKIVELSSGVKIITDDKGTPNPHVWLDVSNAVIQVKNTCEAMCEIDPSRRTLYERNAEAYIKKLTDLESFMKRELAPYAGERIITFHEAFPYFAAEFGFQVAAVVEREPASAPSAREMADIIGIAKGEGVKAIFAEPQYPSSSAEIIGQEAGIEVYLLDPASSGPDEPDAYLKIMEKNLSVLKDALK